MRTTHQGMLPFMITLIGFATCIESVCKTLRLHLGLPDGRCCKKTGLSHSCERNLNP